MRYLDFEKELSLLDLELKNSLASEAEEILKKIDKCEEKTFKKMSDFQILQISRHPDRPHCLDYIDNILDKDSDFDISGDRAFSDDEAIVCRFGKINGEKVLMIGEQKGRDVILRKKHNFGMPHPEGYRKALRIAKLAEKFNIPIFMFIDTPGAFPGIGAEERGQSSAIATNLYEFSDLKVPTFSLVIGEGGSGGALAIGVANKLIMLEYSIFSVISPEGCSAILWKDSEHVEKASEALKITSHELKENNLIQMIIEEGSKPAHRHPKVISSKIKICFTELLKEYKTKTPDEIISERYEVLRNIKYPTTI